jgi:hypothetical protein
MSTEFVMLAIAGVGMVAFAVPLYLGKVPRNPIYGVRFPATLARDEVWYPINARGGRDLIAIGLTYLGLLVIGYLRRADWSLEQQFGVPCGFMVVALIVDAIILWRASENLKRQL